MRVLISLSVILNVFWKLVAGELDIFEKCPNYQLNNLFEFDDVRESFIDHLLTHASLFVLNILSRNGRDFA